MSKNRILAGLIIILVFSFFLLSHFAEEYQKTAGATSFSDASSGIRTFKRLKEKVAPDSVQISRRPSFSLEELKGYDTFMVLDPKMKISPLEAKVIKNYVFEGGRLILSFSTQKNYYNLLNVLTELNINFFTIENDEFKNGETEIITPGEVTPIWTPLQKIAFYSPLLIKDEACNYNRFYCFVSAHDYFGGRVFIFSGLLPFSNAMLIQGENAGLGIRMALWTGKTLIDEYHHFFSEKSFSDLLVDFNFVLPSLALIFGCVLFFLFSQSKLEWLRNLEKDSRDQSSFHEFYTKILDGVFEKQTRLTEAIEIHSQYLKTHYPAHKNEVDELTEIDKKTINKNQIAKDKEIVGKLIQLHRKLISLKGRKNGIN